MPLAFTACLPLLGQEPATITLPEVVVTGESSDYRPPVVNKAGLKADIPLLKTPQAVSIVTDALIKDQGTRKLEEIIKNVAGVSPGGEYAEWDYYSIRGFDASFSTYLDGLRGDYEGMGVETFGLERVEVIKGPASTLYGQAPLGGIVNLVSKKPMHEFGGEIGFTAGSWGLYESTLDVNLPLTAADSDLGIYMRLNALYNEHGSFMDFYHAERLFIAPALTFEFSEDTSLTLLARYQLDQGLYSVALPARGTVLPNPHGQIPISTFIGDPDKTGGIDVENLRLGYEFKHRFNDHLSLRQNLGFFRVEQSWAHGLYNAVLGDDLRTLYVTPFNYQNGVIKRTMVDTAVDFTFETRGTKHTLTAGVDYFYSHNRSRYQDIDYDDFPGSYVAIDLFKPDHISPCLTTPFLMNLMLGSTAWASTCKSTRSSRRS